MFGQRGRKGRMAQWCFRGAGVFPAACVCRSAGASLVSGASWTAGCFHANGARARTLATTRSWPDVDGVPSIAGFWCIQIAPGNRQASGNPLIYQQHQRVAKSAVRPSRAAHFWLSDPVRSCPAFHRHRSGRPAPLLSLHHRSPASCAEAFPVSAFTTGAFSGHASVPYEVCMCRAFMCRACRLAVRAPRALTWACPAARVPRASARACLAARVPQACLAVRVPRPWACPLRVGFPGALGLPAAFAGPSRYPDLDVGLRAPLGPLQACQPFPSLRPSGPISNSGFQGPFRVPTAFPVPRPLRSLRPRFRQLLGPASASWVPDPASSFGLLGPASLSVQSARRHPSCPSALRSPVRRSGFARPRRPQPPHDLPVGAKRDLSGKITTRRVGDEMLERL